MSADVMRVEEWQAYCHECGWWGDRMDDATSADIQADDHDDEHHAGEAGA